MPRLLKNDQIVQRIARELGVANLSEILSEQLSGSDLHSLLLAVIKLLLGDSKERLMTSAIGTAHAGAI